ncbi:unnamed protein product [Amoebophrya sp. A120]|nr:unnamed protein product [Amoebophrya sp. A120]|eukprot:GSA120T00013522001.1
MRKMFRRLMHLHLFAFAALTKNLVSFLDLFFIFCNDKHDRASATTPDHIKHEQSHRGGPFIFASAAQLLVQSAYPLTIDKYEHGRLLPKAKQGLYRSITGQRLEDWMNVSPDTKFNFYPEELLYPVRFQSSFAFLPVVTEQKNRVLPTPKRMKHFYYEVENPRKKPWGYRRLGMRVDAVKLHDDSFQKHTTVDRARGLVSDREALVSSLRKLRVGGEGVLGAGGGRTSGKEPPAPTSCQPASTFALHVEHTDLVRSMEDGSDQKYPKDDHDRSFYYDTTGAGGRGPGPRPPRPSPAGTTTPGAAGSSASSGGSSGSTGGSSPWLAARTERRRDARIVGLGGGHGQPGSMISSRPRTPGLLDSTRLYTSKAHRELFSREGTENLCRGGDDDGLEDQAAAVHEEPGRKCTPSKTSSASSFLSVSSERDRENKRELQREDEFFREQEKLQSLHPYDRNIKHRIRDVFGLLPNMKRVYTVARPASGGKFCVILYFHGNGENVEESYEEFLKLAAATGCDVLAPEYANYVDVEEERENEFWEERTASASWAGRAASTTTGAASSSAATTAGVAKNTASRTTAAPGVIVEEESDKSETESACCENTSRKKMESKYKNSVPYLVRQTGRLALDFLKNYYDMDKIDLYLHGFSIGAWSVVSLAEEILRDNVQLLEHEFWWHQRTSSGVDVVGPEDERHNSRQDNYVLVEEVSNSNGTTSSQTQSRGPGGKRTSTSACCSFGRGGAGLSKRNGIKNICVEDEDEDGSSPRSASSSSKSGFLSGRESRSSDNHNEQATTCCGAAEPAGPSAVRAGHRPGGGVSVAASSSSRASCCPFVAPWQILNWNHHQSCSPNGSVSSAGTTGHRLLGLGDYEEEELCVVGNAGGTNSGGSSAGGSCGPDASTLLPGTSIRGGPTPGSYYTTAETTTPGNLNFDVHHQHGNIMSRPENADIEYIVPDGTPRQEQFVTGEENHRGGDHSFYETAPTTELQKNHQQLPLTSFQGTTRTAGGKNDTGTSTASNSNPITLRPPGSGPPAPSTAACSSSSGRYFSENKLQKKKIKISGIILENALSSAETVLTEAYSLPFQLCGAKTVFGCAARQMTTRTTSEAASASFGCSRAGREQKRHCSEDDDVDLQEQDDHDEMNDPDSFLNVGKKLESIVKLQQANEDWKKKIRSRLNEKENQKIDDNLDRSTTFLRDHALNLLFLHTLNDEVVGVESLVHNVQAVLSAIAPARLPGEEKEESATLMDSRLALKQQYADEIDHAISKHAALFARQSWLPIRWGVFGGGGPLAASSTPLDIKRVVDENRDNNSAGPTSHNSAVRAKNNQDKLDFIDPLRSLRSEVNAAQPKFAKKLEVAEVISLQTVLYDYGGHNRVSAPVRRGFMVNIAQGVLNP